MTVYEYPYFYGKSCTKNLALGQYDIFMFNNHDDCDMIFYTQIRSFKVRGDRCKAKVFGLDGHNEDFFGNVDIPELSLTNLTNQIFYAFLFELSADVILTTYFDYVNRRSFAYDYSYLHVCSSTEVDNGLNIAKLDSNSPDFGWVYEGEWTMYSHEKVTPMPDKKSWCCLDEFPKLTEELVYSNEAFSKCAEKTRIAPTELRGVQMEFIYRRRLCTVNDLTSHFHYKNTTFAMGFAASTENDVVLIGKIGANLDVVTNLNGNTLYRVWCCDEDCYPVFYQCIEDKDCCTFNCVNNICAFPETTGGDDDGENGSGERKMGLLSRIIIFLVGLYFFGWILRFCCPKRKRFDRRIKIH
ncbi:hypothetical protein MHBO_001318 [Bonamia ostreae]|uniref:Uncharacterized protein n=1 Tax=Bonamia ostreae TaxID=126728 RepID=A0ABV2AIJ3_9EUKA